MTATAKNDTKAPKAALPSDRLEMIDLLADLSEGIAKGDIDHIVVTALGRHTGSMMASKGTRTISNDTVIGALQISLTRLVNETIEASCRRASPIIRASPLPTIGRPQ